MLRLWMAAEGKVSEQGQLIQQLQELLFAASLLHQSCAAVPSQETSR